MSHRLTAWAEFSYLATAQKVWLRHLNGYHQGSGSARNICNHSCYKDLTNDGGDISKCAILSISMVFHSKSIFTSKNLLWQIHLLWALSLTFTVVYISYAMIHVSILTTSLMSQTFTRKNGKVCIGTSAYSQLYVQNINFLHHKPQFLHVHYSCVYVLHAHNTIRVKRTMSST